MSAIAAASATDAEIRTARYVAACLLLVAGATATTATFLAVDGSTTVVAPGSAAFLRALFVAVYVVVGTYTWLRRPDSRLGLLIVGAGFLFALTSLNASASTGVYPLGRLLFSVFAVWLVYVALCYPRDRLTPGLERRFVTWLAVAETGLWLAALLVAETFPAGGPWADCGDMCPGNAFNVVDSPTVGDGMNVLVTGVTAIALTGVAVAIAFKVRRAAPLQRRAYVPVLWAIGLLIAGYVVYTISRRTSWDAADDALRLVTAVGALSLPLAMLVGQARSRAFAASGVGTLVTDSRSPTPEHVQALVREALGDPDAAFVVRDGRGRFLDGDGRVVDLEGAPAVGRTLVTRNGHVVAALLHDPVIANEAGARAMAGAAFTLVENARLVRELRASRARLATTAEEERRRLERDLHDGAQQRLFALKLKLDDLRLRTPAAAAELHGAGEDLSAALDELRAVAHGIYPPVLLERGVGEALRARAMRTPAHVQVSDDGTGRFDPTAELTCYFCATEAIQNATRHAGRSATIAVTLRRSAGDVVFEVTDDGVGFDAAGTSGFGLVSMRDRVDAVGGRLDIVSSPGAGTTIRGRVPADLVAA
ncbi:MAG: ATP-binding protein [Gaiellaceae bacterium]